MFSCGLARDCPYLLKPFLVLLLREPRRVTLHFSGLPVSSGLSQHQNKLCIILYNGVWLVGLAQKRRTIFNFVASVGDLVPNDRSEIIKANAACSDNDVGVHWHYDMAAMFAARETYITHNAHNPSARNESPKAMRPDSI